MSKEIFKSLSIAEPPLIKTNGVELRAEIFYVRIIGTDIRGYVVSLYEFGILLKNSKVFDEREDAKTEREKMFGERIKEINNILENYE